MGYYGTYNGVVAEFDGNVPSAYWTESAIKAVLLPMVYDVINAELAPYYYVPFDNTTIHPLGVPPYLNHLACTIAKTRIMQATFEDKRPRKSGSFDKIVQDVREALKRVKLAAGKDYVDLIYSDGSVVPRRTSMPVPADQVPYELYGNAWTEIDDDGVDNNVYYPDSE